MADPSFEEWLHEYPKRRELAEIFEQNNGGPLPPEFKAYLVNSSRRNAQQFRATRDWLDRSGHLCRRILSGESPNAEYVLFWIYLHGLTEELFEREDRHRGTTMLIPWRRPVVEAIDALRACFNEAELSFIRFMRHNHVHIFVDYPWKQMKTKEGKIMRVREAADPAAVANAEAILRRYGNNQQDAGADFVKKAIRAIDALDKAFTEASAA